MGDDARIEVRIEDDGTAKVALPVAGLIFGARKNESVVEAGRWYRYDVKVETSMVSHEEPGLLFDVHGKSGKVLVAFLVENEKMNIRMGQRKPVQAQCDWH